jgi:hypothetical protein
MKREFFDTPLVYSFSHAFPMSHDQSPASIYLLGFTAVAVRHDDETHANSLGMGSA